MSETPLRCILPPLKQAKEEDTTMNRKNELPKPEMPMPQGGQMPEIMRAIMPDFPKWNRLFFQLDCVFVIINLVLTSTFFVFSSGKI